MPNWKKLVVSGSDATLNSLNITTSVTASNFTGSFSGDGSGLSGVTTTIEQISAVGQSFSNQTTINVNHALNTSNPIIQVYDDNDEQVIPQTIRIVDANNVQIIFSTSTSGKVVVAKGGHIVSGSSVDAVSVTTDQIVLNSGNSYTIVTTGSVTTGIFDETALIDPVISPSTYSGANIEYTIQRSGANRSGTIMASWSGSNVSFTDISTVGIGDTSDLTFDVVLASGNIRLRAYSAGSGSGDWGVYALFKLFPHTL